MDRNVEYFKSSEISSPGKKEKAASNLILRQPFFI